MASKKKSAGLLLDEVLPQAQRTARSLLSLDPQEDVPASQQALEMALGFVPGIGQAMALRDIERARRANDPAAAAMAAASFVPFGRLAGLGKKAGPVMSELDVYHGSPHRFPGTETNPLGEFDASKIGTGEGAQAYGHGIYFAESPKVAEGYKKTVTQSMTTGAQRRLQSAGNDIDKAIAETEAKLAKYRQGGAKSYAEVAEEDLRGLKQYKQSGEWASGNLYTADLPDEMIDRMLDWDKPLSEQPEVVQQTLAKLDPDSYSPQGMDYSPEEPGQMIYMRIANSPLAKNQAEAAAALKAAGIPGLRYLDAGSRGQGGSGTRNFVVFPGEEKKVKIKKRE